MAGSAAALALLCMSVCMAVNWIDRNSHMHMDVNCIDRNSQLVPTTGVPNYLMRNQTRKTDAGRLGVRSMKPIRESIACRPRSTGTAAAASGAPTRPGIPAGAGGGMADAMGGGGFHRMYCLSAGRLRKSAVQNCP